MLALMGRKHPVMRLSGSLDKTEKPTHFDFFAMITNISAEVLYLQCTDKVWSVLLGVSVTQSGETSVFVPLWLFYEGSQYIF